MRHRKAIFSLFSILSAFLPGCKSSHPTRYLIASGYVGWVRVSYNVANAAPLPLEKGFYVVKIPLGGAFQTSSKLAPGWEGDEFYYYTEDGRQTRLPRDTTGPGLIWGAEKVTQSDQPYESFFVGTTTAFYRAGPSELSIGGGPSPVIVVPVH